MSRFYPLTVAAIRRETKDCISLTFDIPGELKEEFEFKQGQHITLKKEINGEDVRRSYSICSSPLEDELRVAIKKVAGGQFSTYANEKLKAGDSIEVMPPMGHFFVDLDPDSERTYLAVAAGSGITPIISIIKTTLARESRSQFILLYGNKGSKSIIFHEELEALKNQYLRRFAIHHFFSQEALASELFNGRINRQKVEGMQKLVDYGSVNEVFICGPEDMMSETRDTFIECQIDQRHIHLELFTSPVGKLGVSRADLKKSKPTVKSEVTVILDGVQFDFSIDSDEPILDVAVKKGVDLPFSCKGGVCSTCKAKLIEGKVHMDTNYALEAEEIEAGFILTCQSHPETSKVIVSYD